MGKGKIIVASMMVFCVLIFIAAIAFFMMYQGELTEPTSEEKHAAILNAAGLLKSDAQDEKTIKNLFQRYILSRKVDLDSGEWVADDAVAQECKKLAPEHDPAKIYQRCAIADVYLVKNKNNKIQQIILPIFGKGAKSMMHAFLALDPDGRTVKNLYYYQQRETPFLGARVEDESWRKQWPGKKVVDNNGKPVLRITQEKPGNIDEYTVDGISGATLTSMGVENSINYWTGEQGYGRFLQRITRDPDIIAP
ncbi:NADH:ubiquinone reductase (Na(+)-transporting) subunit C [Citrobacter europaeus]|uniref:NADH:ubiquinone reductase (Na(+)-transporting) subunit C n=1 Tax=Citrobacter europaeus TaxID=1914243 RepID=UPI001C8D0B76|nr:NADH:ubiquinone reductase (Na(+)-transporting) subunit C [Citrobacter europaeus]MBY1055181.1 NADH:ubiquinone reductase (Na(+)-transporting) subunit C [Citrobacter europaeus]